MTTFPKMAAAFPSFDQRTLPAIPAGWQDCSWSGDICPSFIAAGDFTCRGPFAHVFIDFAEPSARDIPESARFAVVFVNGASQEASGEIQSDDWAAILQAIEQWEP